MEVVYKKNGNKSFMIITSKNLDENDYKLQMVLNNSIKGLLPISVKTVNNFNELYYETTSLISLKSLFAKKQIDHKNLIELVQSLKFLEEELKEYLLDINHILYDFEYIFTKRQGGTCYFCYDIGGDNKQEQLKNLFDTLLEYLDYQDRLAVEIAYGIQQITISEEFVMQDIFAFMSEKLVEKAELEEKYEENLEEVLDFAKEKRKYIEGIGIIDKLRQIFFQKHYKRESDLKEEKIYEKNEEKYLCQEKINMEENELNEATVCLRVNENAYSIRFRSTNLEKPIIIIPNKYPCTLGKSMGRSDYILDSPVVSRVHIKLFTDEYGYYIEDLNSTNGTYLNHIQLMPHSPKKIKKGDRLTIANIDFMVE